MSSGVELLFNDSRAGTALYRSPVSPPITFDECETSGESKRGESKLPLSCSQNVVGTVASQKVHHRHKPCEPASLRAHLGSRDVWPAALPCQMAYYTEHSPTATLQNKPPAKWHRIYTHFVGSACLVKSGLRVLPPPPQPKSLQSRLNPRQVELLHTTAGPDSFLSRRSFQSSFPLHYTHH